MTGEMMLQQRDTVTLSGGMDRYGLTVARVTFDRSDDRAGRRLEASGARTVRRQPDDASRPVDTVRMGVNPSSMLQVPAECGRL